MGGWPDGTLVMENLARAPGCTLQGFFALANCPNLEDTPPSALVAVDSKTFKVLDWMQLEQRIGGRLTATQYHGKDYAYLPGTTDLYLHQWDDHCTRFPGESMRPSSLNNNHSTFSSSVYSSNNLLPLEVIIILLIRSKTSIIA
jgi:hypothetical protein